MRERYHVFFEGSIIRMADDAQPGKPEEIAKANLCELAAVDRPYDPHNDLPGVIHLKVPKLPEPPTTEEVLKEMLTENTGRHFLDSGGAYRRNWERNQERDFDSEPATTIDFRFGYLDITHNVYHWLKERLVYEPYMDRVFHRYARMFFTEREPRHEVMEAFRKSLKKKGRFQYDMGENSCNGGDSLLSQVIQWHEWHDDQRGENYIFLEIHGGCDVRGGYTAPRIFTPCWGDEFPLAYDQDATVTCAGKRVTLRKCANGHRWDVPYGSADIQAVFCPECFVTESCPIDDYYHYHRWFSDEDFTLDYADTPEYREYGRIKLHEMEFVEIEGPDEWQPIGEDDLPVVYWYKDEKGRGIGLCPFDGTKLEAH